MKNTMKDTTRIGGKITTHEISPVTSSDPRVRRESLVKIKEDTSVHKVLNMLLLAIFTMGFGVALLIVLVTHGPIHKVFFMALFAGIVVAEVIMCFGSSAMYLYIKERLNDWNSSDAFEGEEPTEKCEKHSGVGHQFDK